MKNQAYLFLLAAFLGLAVSLFGAETANKINFSEVALTGELSPAQITADQNNYNPTDLSTAARLRLSSDANRNVTGLAGGTAGRLLTLFNIGSNKIILVDESASSTAANRFALNGNLSLNADTGVTLQYDGTSSRWRAAAYVGGGGGGAGNAIPKWDSTSALTDSAITDDGITVTIGNAEEFAIYDGLGTNPGLKFAADTDTGIYRRTAGVISFVANGTSSSDVNFEVAPKTISVTPDNQTDATPGLLLSGKWDNAGSASQAFRISYDDAGAGSLATTTFFEAQYLGITRSKVLRNGTLGTLAGIVATNDYALAGGTLKVDTTTTGNVGAGEDNLITYSIDAGALQTNGDYIEFDMVGTFAATANTKQLKAHFGATVLLDTTSLVLNGLDWRIHGKVIRTGAATQKATAECTIGGTLLSALNGTITDYTTPAETMTGAITIKATGQDTGGVPADNAVVQELLVVKYYPGQ